MTGVVAPPDRHDEITAALAAVGLDAVAHVHDLGHDDVPLFGPEAVKGLEFDGVVVVNPHEILDGTSRGARLLYVAMTRAVQELAFVTDGEHPAIVGLTATRPGHVIGPVGVFSWFGSVGRVAEGHAAGRVLQVGPHEPLELLQSGQMADDEILGDRVQFAARSRGCSSPVHRIRT